MSVTFISEQVNAIIDKILNLPSDMSVTPVITDDSFCFEHNKPYFFAILINELQKKNIPFGKIRLDKFFYLKTTEEKESFLIEKSSGNAINITRLS